VHLPGRPELAHHSAQAGRIPGRVPDFDVSKIATMDQAEVDALLADPGIIRNRKKIFATVHNASVARNAPEPLEHLAWRFAPASSKAPWTVSQIPARTRESAALAAELRASSYQFVGPVIAYAFMQSIGVVNDHIAGCFLAQ
jgi:DNA-3-methyladenine glycosylase I